MSCVRIPSPATNSAAGREACANCGKEGNDDDADAITLKNCTACRLVKYCGVDCQRAHRKQHKEACRQRAAELKDESLYHGARKAGGGLLPDMHSADSATNGPSFGRPSMLYEEDL